MVGLMWLVMWFGGIVCLGVLGGLMGAMVSRTARPGVSLLSQVVSAFFVDRIKSIRWGSHQRVPSRG